MKKRNASNYSLRMNLNNPKNFDIRKWNAKQSNSVRNLLTVIDVMESGNLTFADNVISCNIVERIRNKCVNCLGNEDCKSNFEDCLTADELSYYKTNYSSGI